MPALLRHMEQRDAARRDDDLPRRERLLVGVALPGSPAKIETLFTSLRLSYLHIQFVHFALYKVGRVNAFAPKTSGNLRRHDLHRKRTLLTSHARPVHSMRMKYDTLKLKSKTI